MRTGNVRGDCLGGDTLAVLLIQLEALKADVETQQAIADWHYWVNQGYEFG